MEPATGDPRHDSCLWFFAWFAGALALGLGLYHGLLDTPPYSDDLPILCKLLLEQPHWWGGVLRPDSNMFFRPMLQAFVGLTVSLFGMRPVPLHLLCIVIHALNAALVGQLAWRLGFSRLGRHLAVLLFTAHLGASGSVWMFSYSYDATATIGMLLGLIGWLEVLRSPAPRGYALLWGGFAFALLSKETSAVFPAWCLLACWLAPGRGFATARHHRRALVGLALVGMVWLGAMILLQTRMAQSYVMDGRVRFSLSVALTRLTDYALAVWWPYRILELPAEWHGLALRWSPVLVLDLVVIAVVVLWRLGRRSSRHWPVLLLLTLPTLLLPSMNQLELSARYTYASLPFYALVVSELFCEMRSPRWPALLWSARAVAVLATWCHVFGFYTSPTLIKFELRGQHIGAYAREIKRLSPTWKDGDSVLVLNNPHPMPPPYNWIYNQLLFNLNTAGKRIHVRLEGPPADADWAYRFMLGKLVPLPHSLAPGGADSV